MPNLGYALKPTDRRERPRNDLRYDVDFDFYSSDGQRMGSGWGETVNVSAGGMLIETEKPLEPSMQMIIQIISPLTMFIAKGTVVHAKKLDEKTYHAGIHFNEMINAEWELAGELGTITPAQESP